MLSVASLLNPAPPGPPPSTPRYRPSPALSSPATSYSSECHSLVFERHALSSSKQSKMARDNSGFVKSRAKGMVNYPPFENLDEASLRQIRNYQIYPFGRIQDFCRHIPYNSGKKNFFDKTGRESFEVFQYTFRVPGDDSEYTVMWDYNVGLVRMTPFFKCCKYSKTQPAKMLNMNPGLRDITHSITGGSIMAQGYWMPFTCAKAVCATFCASIAGALIPIFGPKFPSECVPPEAPEYGRMAIDQALVAEAASEAELYRRMYANANSVHENNQLPHHYDHYNRHHHHHHHQQQQQQPQHHYYNHSPTLPSPTSIPSPRMERRALTRYSSPHEYEQERATSDGRLQIRRGPDSSYGTPSEPEISARMETPSPLHHASLASRGALFPPLSPPRSTGWTVVNNNSTMSGGNNHDHNNHDHINSMGLYHHDTYREEEGPAIPYSSNANPLLSAVPRFSEHASSSTSAITNSPHHHPDTYSRHRLPYLPLGLTTPTTVTTTPSNGSSNHRYISTNNSTTWSAVFPPNRIKNPKRRATDLLDDVVDSNDDYDNHSGNSPTTTTTTATSQDEMGEDHHRRRHRTTTITPNANGGGGSSGIEKNAALLLLNLSVRDNNNKNNFCKHSERDSCNSNGSCYSHVGRAGAAQHRFPRSCGPESMSMSPVAVSGAVDDGHRSKRRRATSM